MAENDDMGKSLARSKKSFISLADVTGKEVFSSLIPGSGILYELSKILLKHGVEFYHDHVKARVEDFHRALLEGTPEEELKEFLEKPISLEDYYTFLSNAVRDDEESKIAVYSKMFKALVHGIVPQEYKLHFIKSARELTYSDIELMHKLYIEYKDKGVIFAEFKKVIDTNDPITNFSIQTLIRLGFLLEKDIEDPTWGEIGKKKIEPSNLLEVFVKAIYSPEELSSEPSNNAL
ncbi:MAG TPA: hypothetical protein VJ000_01075 [Thermodesulfovibrionia bacterium]|nr:hypothetical protein [Thermodesulfovibrionia bacterium]